LAWRRYLVSWIIASQPDKIQAVRPIRPFSHPTAGLGKKFPVPSLLALFAFRWGRTSLRVMLDESFKDYAQYKKAGWFEADFCHPTRLNP